MPKYYEMADAMLVTLTKDPVISLTIPGKVQTYMAAGKPIVGAINGETSIVLNDVQGGYCGEAENSEELAKNIIKLYKSGLSKNIGQKNGEYYKRMFSKEKFMEELEKFLRGGIE